MPAVSRPRPATAVAALGLASLVVLVAGGSYSAAPRLGTSNPSGAVGSTVVELLTAPTTSVLDETARAIRRAGGEVLDRFSVAETVRALVRPGTDLPADASVVPDTSYAVAGTATASTGTPAGTDPADVLRGTLAAPAIATGAGITVALVDTGVADVPRLSGRVTGRVDVTGDTSTGTGNAATDGFGHGTFLAGLVAGAGTGVAPDAHVFDVRVAHDDGSTSLSLVLAGLQAVADRHRVDPSLRIVNLAITSASPLPAPRDPLAVALDRLWRDGLTVVVPAGNDGPAGATVGSPGTDPTLLTVGALDDAGTTARGDDTVADFSSRGPTPYGDMKPDVVAAGTHLISSRAPGSVADADNPQARVGDDLFRGSGTSMAAAVTAGVVADLVAARPELSPDDVKALLAGTAYTTPSFTAVGAAAAGSGGLDLGAALTAAVPSAVDNAATAVGGGTTAADLPVEADAARWGRFGDAWARGDLGAVRAAWTQLDIRTQQWASNVWADAVAANAAAHGDNDEWTGRSWSARSWSARSWSGRSWSAEQWLARSWSARSWSDDGWSARSWSARSWSARSWSARSWSARSWSTGEWSARSWTAVGWQR